MPNWATRITTISQLVTVLAAAACILILALNRIIDGAAAVTALMLVTGAGAAVNATVHAVNKADMNTPPVSGHQVPGE